MSSDVTSLAAGGGKPVRLLCVSGLFPFPTDIGTAIHVWGLGEALDRAFDAHFLLLQRPDTTAAHVAEVRRRLRGTVETFVPPAAPGGNAGGLQMWMRAAAIGAPPWVLDEFSNAMADRVSTLSRGVSGVVFLYDRGLYVRAARAAPGVIVTVRHEIEGWTFRDRDTAALAPRARARTLAAGRLVRCLERRAICHSDLVVVTSEEEDTRMHELYGQQADAIVPAAIRPQPAWTPHGGDPTVGYLGSLDYGPNVDGLVRFIEEGWSAAPPAAGLVIAGRAPSARVMALHDRPSVEVLEVSEGFDAFLPGFLQRIHVGVVPLWSGGAGVKLKTLTLLGAGVPTVLTPVAAQGLPLRTGVHCLIVHSPRQMVSATARLLGDHLLASRLGAAGRDLVSREYVWPVVGPRFAEFVGGQLARS